MKKKAPNKLTSKQEKFCQAYVLLGDKSAAYREAYSTSNMKSTTINRKAVKIFNEGKIRARIEELQRRAEKRNELSVDWVLKKLKKIVEENDPKDRVAALDKLMKHFGGYDKDNDKKVTVTVSFKD